MAAFVHRLAVINTNLVEDTLKMKTKGLNFQNDFLSDYGEQKKKKDN